MGVMAVKDRYTILCGDARKQLRNVESDSVQVCVTSPPYFGLRDYGTAKWVGGDPDCAHSKPMHQSKGSTLNGGKGGGDKLAAIVRSVGQLCKCGARRIDRQIGIEASPQKYIESLVLVFDEVRRVLKPDGVCFINIGDSYASSGGSRPTQTMHDSKYKGELGVKPQTDNYKPKDLLGIPWMLAFALRDAGWYLRQDIIWSKKNPLPESVRDRCTKSHEYIFHLSKSPRYYFDGQAIAEPIAESSVARISQDVESQTGSLRAHAGAAGKPPQGSTGKVSAGGLGQVWRE
jgi:DNA modification methylase